MRASVTVEEPPQRQARASTAEVPVTRRIRRQKEEPVVAEEVKPEPVKTPTAALIASPKSVKADYRQQIARRRGNELQMTLF